MEKAYYPWFGIINMGFETENMKFGNWYLAMDSYYKALNHWVYICWEVSWVIHTVGDEGLKFLAWIVNVFLNGALVDFVAFRTSITYAGK